jgi:hypothetical protein
MADRRIYELATKSAALGANDYFAVDNGTEAESKKLPTTYFTDQLSDMQNVYGAKNLIPYPCNNGTRTNNGITFTDNGDGTVTANGTATADASYNMSQRFGVSGNSFSLKNGNYLLSGCESGSNTTFFIQTGVTKNNAFSLLNKNFDGDTAITVDGDDDSNDSANIAVQIVVRSGQTLTNKVFKPMIRLASIQDNTWVPYVPTNKELMSCKLNGYVGAKNLLPYPYYNTTMTESGLTITDNGDGTVKVNGTATATVRFRCTPTSGTWPNNPILKKGIPYILTGCAEGAGDPQSAIYSVTLYNSSDQVIGRDFGDGFTYIPSADEKLNSISIVIWAGAVCNNIVFEPMLRIALDSDSTYQPYAKTNKELTDAFKNQVANKADEYSSSKAYAVGDRCIYNNVLYKCITACSAAAWSVNQTNFEATTLAESVGELNSALMQLDSRKSNKFTNLLIDSGASNLMYIPFSALPTMPNGLGTIELAFVTYNGKEYNDLRAKFQIRVQSNVPSVVALMFRDSNSITCTLDTANSRIKCETDGWYTYAFIKVTTGGDY